MRFADCGKSQKRIPVLHPRAEVARLLAVSESHNTEEEKNVIEAYLAANVDFLSLLLVQMDGKFLSNQDRARKLVSLLLEKLEKTK